MTTLPPDGLPLTLHDRNDEIEDDKDEGDAPCPVDTPLGIVVAAGKDAVQDASRHGGGSCSEEEGEE